MQPQIIQKYHLILIPYVYNLTQTYIRRYIRTHSYIKSHQMSVINLFTATFAYVLHPHVQTFVATSIKISREFFTLSNIMSSCHTASSVDSNGQKHEVTV